MKNKIYLYLVLLNLSCCILYGQIDQYNFKQQLNGIENQWHKVVLPNTIFNKISHDFSDIRIYGISANNDTIEVPYIFHLDQGETDINEISFEVINQSRKGNLHYFTFVVNGDKALNKIELDFKQQNFDWKANLEGSPNQKEWFTILENYRILSIKNELTDFQFTQLSFPKSSYRYMRLAINTNEKPILSEAKLSHKTIIDGMYRNYPINHFSREEDKKNKQTTINLQLESDLPLSHLKFDITDDVDYYRTVTIKYLADSFETQKGWKYNYFTLTTGTLNSIEENEFAFSSAIVQKLRVIINNHDNEPLSINSIEAKGYLHTLVARFTEPANYFLTFGNKSARRPIYDISRFSDKIPEDLESLELGEVEIIEHEETPETEPLFINETWLWLVMIIIIIMLGWFSLRMINKK